jgi:hypothetical protein
MYHVANLTLAIDDALLHRARVRAAQERTTVNAVVRMFLESYGADERRAAATRLVQLARAHATTTGTSWTRDDLYTERIDRYGPDRLS